MAGGIPIYLFYRLVLLLGTVLALVVAAVAWRNRPNTGAHYLALTAVGVAIWTAPSLLQSLTDSLFLDELLNRLAYLGITLTMPSWFLLAAEYTGRDRFRARPIRAAIWTVAATMLVVALSGFVVEHQLLYTEVTPQPDTLTGLSVEHGLAFYLWVGVGYLLSFGALIMFLDWFYRSTDLYRRQAAIVVLAAIAPLTGNVLYVGEVVAIDATPFGFAFGTAALGFGVFQFRFTDVTPVARESLMTNIRDGVIVVDTEGRITDVNPAAKRLLGLDSGVIGREATAVLEEPIGELAAEAGASETQTLVELAGPTGNRYLDVRVWPQSDDRGRSLGHLFYLRDVTERRRRERELERQNERLDRFASLLSHDLRNPLSVAEGYVELARETDDVSHLDDVEIAHERMEELIEDVLAMAREGETVTDPEPTSLGSVARTAWETVDTPDATLDVRTDATVLAAPVRLRRLFENLFRNAVEHGSTSPCSQARGDAVEHGSTSSRTESDDAVERGRQEAGTHLTITVGDLSGGSDGDAATGFYVADDGVGIPSTDRDSVLDDGYTTDEDGTGLGLSVVQSIVDAHGWELRVTESEAGGARFEFVGVSRPTTEPATPTDG